MDKLVFSQDLFQDIALLLQKGAFTSAYILTDRNTFTHCLPLLPQELRDSSTLITVPAGEESKNLQNAEKIWSQLLEKEADRNAVLINLGGGMVTDLGSFAASTYKRGISYINIPTTLLGIVDAAIGGKTGINFGEIKNTIGTFAMPYSIIFHTPFLYTLPECELRSGYAEVIKYALIADAELWQNLQIIFNPEQLILQPEIMQNCMKIKQEITIADPHEKGVRKVLNFGHTIGHALESLSYQKNENQSLHHGEAVAIGMIVEAYLSHAINGMPQEQMQAITDYMLKFFKLYEISENDYEEIFALMRNDKKNSRGNFRLVLLDKIGKAVFDVPCSENEVRKALDFYRSLL
ncbi:MAG: 3-dehydroquinate synthase [Sphingobacteriales bacterium]|nr:MAG: 3-dehydroquinate synthase [Sphingobacteriales bacterium]